MTWSWTTISIVAAASTRALVIVTSARDGLGSPEGWLCATINALASNSRTPADHFTRIERGLIYGATTLRLSC